MSEAEVLLHAVISGVIAPFLNDLATEVDQPITVKVLLGLGSQVVEHDCSTSAGLGSGLRGQGEVRVLAKSVSTGRFSFSAEAVLNGVSPGTGFSGFSSRGRCVDESGRMSATQTSYVVRYNVWTWAKEFAL
jgi:hypothetical protein